MEGSFHYKNLALDVRTNDLKPEIAAEFYFRMKGLLGPDFDVVKEADHCHIEPSKGSLLGKV